MGRRIRVIGHPEKGPTNPRSEPIALCREVSAVIVREREVTVTVTGSWDDRIDVTRAGSCSATA
jgi:hypothetical protein